MANTNKEATSNPEVTKIEIGSTEHYQQMLDQLSAKGGEKEFYYLKPGKNKLRLLPEFAKKATFYATVMRSWQGQAPKPRYIIKALTWNEANEPAVKGVVLPKTVLVQIAGFLAEGHDLFSATAGHAFTVTKTGEGLETSYQTVPSPREVPMPTDYEDLELTLDELVELRMARDEELAKKPKTPSANGKGKAEGDADW